MTSPLRRKRLTTAPARSTPARTPARLAAVGLLLLAGGLARAQEPLPPPPAAHPTHLMFNKAREVPAAAPALQPDPGDIRQVQAGFAPQRAPAGFATEQTDYLIQLLPPSYERLTRLYNEEALREQIRQEAKEHTPPERAVFPEERPVTEEPYAPRTFPAQVALVEPAYVNYERLHFQDLNSERYGWELGFAQPFVSAGLFFVDTALLPYQCASRPFDCIESSAGYCLPGDPVPYLLYPPYLSVTGAVGEAAAALGLIAVFP